MSEIKELIPFNIACQDFMKGKYILADMKIYSILKTVEDELKLKQLISSCLEDFNFKANFNACIKQNNEQASFTLPTDEKQVIALVYSLFSALRNKTINFTEFLKTFFSTNDETQILKFAEEVLLPFQRAINSLFAKMHIVVETNEYQNNIYNKLKTSIKLILSNIDNFKLKITEKEEFTMLLNSLFIASEKNDKKLVYSLMIGIDYFSKSNKRVRNAYLSLEECFS